MSARFIFIGILISLLLLAGALSTAYPAAAGDGLPELFGSEVAGLAPSQVDPLAARTHIVRLQPAGLESSRAALVAGEAPGLLALSLFPDTRLVARFERVEYSPDGGFSLAGKIDGSWFGEIHASASGSAFFASVNSPQGLYQITSSDGLTARITQMALNRIPKEDEVVAVSLSGAPAPATPAAIASGPTTTDDGARIDVYVGYTSAARSDAGGPAAIQAVINTAIAETNTGYVNSGINQRVVLVGSGEYAYDETNFDWYTTLDQWSNPADPLFGPAHTARNLLNADEMVLIVNDTSYCGLGYLMGSVTPAYAPYGFAEVSRTCTTGYYSFAHEMGHNMGAHHNREVTSSPGVFPYSYGSWIWMPSTSRYDYRTIMAYDTYHVTDVNGNLLNYFSTRINYWSSPSILYNGQPTGRAAGDPRSADNALTLNNTAWAVAQFRDGPSPSAPANLTGARLNTSQVQLNWTAAFDSFPFSKYRIERATYSGGWGAYSEIAQLSSLGIITYTDTAAASPGEFKYRVLTDNGNGRTASNEVIIPAAPSGLTASSPAANQVKLDWTDNSSVETGFNVQRADLGIENWANIASPGANVQTYTDASLPVGKEARYRVIAVSGLSGFSLPSNGVNGLPIKSTVINNVSMSMSRLNVSWNDNSAIESGFALERSKSGGPWQQIALLPANTTSYSDDPLDCNTAYNYRVRPYNSVGFADYVTATATSTAVCAAPPEPAPLSTVRGARTVQLKWTNVDGESNYYVYQYPTADCSGTPVQKGSVSVNIIDFTFSALTPNTAYCFGVRALNTNGESAIISKGTVTTLSREIFLPGAHR